MNPYFDSERRPRHNHYFDCEGSGLHRNKELIRALIDLKSWFSVHLLCNIMVNLYHLWVSVFVLFLILQNLGLIW